MIRLDEVVGTRAEPGERISDGAVRQRHAGVALGGIAHDHVGGVDQQRAGLAVVRTEIDLDAFPDVDDPVRAEVDETGIARLRAGIEPGAARDGQVLRRLQADLSGIAVCACDVEIGFLADIDVVAGLNGDVAWRCGLALRGQTPVDPGIVDRTDMDRAVADGDRAGAAQTLGVDGGRKFRGMIEIGDIALGGAADIDVLPGQPHAILRIDPAVDADVAVGRDRERAGHQIADGRLVDRPARADQAVGELARRRRDVEAADIHRAGTADHEPLGIGEIDVTADRTVHVGVQRAIDVDRRVANDVDEVLRAGRQLQVDGVALPDAELRERVEGVVAGDRRRRDVGDAAGGLQGRPGASVRNDDVRRLRLNADAEHRQEDHLHRAEQRHRAEARKPPQRRQLIVVSRRRWSAHFISSSSALAPIHNRVGE
ncbi:hypothetical protein ACVIHC_008529 [Bradyrhizobium diazoefficiens]